MKNPFCKDSIRRSFDLNREFSIRFDNVAKKYEKRAFGISKGSKYVSAKEQELITSLFQTHVSSDDEKKVLDLGAGNGRWSKLFLSWGWKVCSLDNSAEMCRVLSTIENLSVVKGNAEDVELEGEFDVIFSVRALKYADLRNVLVNIKKLLSCNGIVIFELPYRYNPFYFFFYYMSLILIYLFRNNRHMKYIVMINMYNNSSMEAVLSLCSYRLLRTEKLLFFPDSIYSKVNNNNILCLLTSVDRFFSKLLPRSLIVIAQHDQV